MACQPIISEVAYREIVRFLEEQKYDPAKLCMVPHDAGSDGNG